jgi:hypothetical protein
MLQKTQTTRALERAILGAIGGALMGVLLLGVGAVRLIIALLTGTSISDSAYDISQLLTLVVIYCGSFAAAGATLAALWPVRKSVLGAYFLGYLGAGIVSVVLGRLVMWVEHDHDLDKFLLTVGIMTVAFGTVAGYRIQRWDRI